MIHLVLCFLSKEIDIKTVKTHLAVVKPQNDLIHPLRLKEQKNFRRVTINFSQKSGNLNTYLVRPFARYVKGISQKVWRSAVSIALQSSTSSCVLSVSDSAKYQRIPLSKINSTHTHILTNPTTITLSLTTWTSHSSYEIGLLSKKSCLSKALWNVASEIGLTFQSSSLNWKLLKSAKIITSVS